MQTYHGSCHCGRIRFEVTTDLKVAVECNCSICAKKGALYHRVAPEQFKLLAGAEALALYQFDSRIAKHWFCKHCGIHPFSNPRAAPDQYSINVRCLDDFDLATAPLEIRQFDGRHWEEAIQTFKLD